MRKINILSTTLFFLICLFAPFSYGCSDNDFIQVRSITYTIAEQTIKHNSHIAYKYSEPISIYEGLYWNAPKEQRFNYDIVGNNIKSLEKNYSIPKSHKGQDIVSIKPEITIDDDLMRYYALTDTWGETHGYYKCQLIEIIYRYVCIKHVNDNTIIVKYDGRETTCMNANVQITHF
ncbi:MAG: hypothetical protein IJX49_06210 [Clostridia bacterium]|nr:hypothetical protein [Clostridia bacterium]